ncbi:MAG: integrase [Candidatus Woesebacteria bacterium GW2011_GWA2_40_7b]|uniref:Integrase n=1 Tax=Candidatus Woesebacteria bacterium GW2011_GWA2_40_7b TaxID=1618563 RepID=A0A0G0SXK4_9BACT|nr:MAG: integrase [Candidatus Woesebacteria bacterium GW2011_GWA2_40_7b]
MRVKPKEIVRTYKRVGGVYKAASLLGVHPTTVYRWLKRAKTKVGTISSNNLKRKSTRPRNINKFEFSSSQKIEIERLRFDKGWMAEKIIKHLNINCHPKTLHRYLIRRRLVRKYGYHRRPRFQNTLHMHLGNTKTIGYLQFDVKYVTPELSGLPYTCFEYAVIDIFSRYKEAVILNHLDQDGSMSAMLEMLPKLPFKPVFIQTDNGLEFQGRFHKMCEDMNLKHHLIHKQTPNENALIERSFRTDEEEFFFRLDKAPDHYDELRDWFATWLFEYNHERPHLGIKLKTPYEVVANVLSG